LADYPIRPRIQASAALTLTRLDLAKSYLALAERAGGALLRARYADRTHRLLVTLRESLTVPGSTPVAPEWLALIEGIDRRLRALDPALADPPRPLH
jgi:hypothetical protein